MALTRLPRLLACFVLSTSVVALPQISAADPSPSLVRETAEDCKTAFELRTTLSEEDPLAPCQGVRPGGALILRAGDIDVIYCSMSFLVTDGRHVYLTTAGHCTLAEMGVPSLGEDVFAHGVREPIGKVAYTWCEGRAANGGCGVGTDFALIRLNSNGVAHASPAMCTWVSPESLFESKDRILRELRHFGWGLGLGGTGAGTTVNGRIIQPANPVTQARHSAGIDFSDPNSVLAWGAAISGDSGSGVLVTELPKVPGLHQPQPKALGHVTHIGPGGLLFVQRLDAGLRKAGAEMRRTFTLWPPPPSGTG